MLLKTLQGLEPHLAQVSNMRDRFILARFNLLHHLLASPSGWFHSGNMLSYGCDNRPPQNTLHFVNILVCPESSLLFRC